GSRCRSATADGPPSGEPRECLVPNRARRRRPPTAAPDAGGRGTRTWTCGPTDGVLAAQTRRQKPPSVALTLLGRDLRRARLDLVMWPVLDHQERRGPVKEHVERVAAVAPAAAAAATVRTHHHDVGGRFAHAVVQRCVHVGGDDQVSPYRASGAAEIV